MTYGVSTESCSVFSRLQNAAGLYSVLACNILMVEYRGYGLSHGYASERGIYMDAQAAMDYLAARTDVNQNRIIVFGRSLGTRILDSRTTSEVHGRLKIRTARIFRLQVER